MQIIKKVSFDFWWEVAKKCPYATFFHSPLWHQIIEETFNNMKSTPIGGIGENGTKMVLPLLQIRSNGLGLFKNYVSTFAGCYGGIIADGPLKKNDTKRVYQEILNKKMTGIHLNGNPLLQLHIDDTNYWPEALEIHSKKDFTQIVSLNSNMDNIVSKFSKSHVRNMKKAFSLGIKVREADTLSDYMEYHKAYKSSLKRWVEEPSIKYPFKLFEKCYNSAQTYPANIKLWLAELKDGTLASGALTFYWNSHIVYWHGAGYSEHFKKRPNNALHPHIIEMGLKEGYKYYDFNPSGGHRGVEAFKGQFGASLWPIRRVKTSGRIKEFIDKYVRETFIE